MKTGMPVGASRNIVRRDKSRWIVAHDKFQLVRTVVKAIAERDKATAHHQLDGVPHEAGPEQSSGNIRSVLLRRNFGACQHVRGVGGELAAHCSGLGALNVTEDQPGAGLFRGHDQRSQRLVFDELGVGDDHGASGPQGQRVGNGR